MQTGAAREAPPRKEPDLSKTLAPPPRPPKRRGPPIYPQDYICLTCMHGFRAMNPTHCLNPKCETHSNFVLKKDYNR
jgi:hypothetical protein